MENEILFKDEAKEKLKIGIDKICDAVKVTSGPQGRNVIINRGMDMPHITKDGVTVAKQIFLNDSYEMMGAQLVKNVASKTCDDVGDGCQPLHCKILTHNGWTTMGEIKIGDEICGTNLSIQTVIGIFNKGARKIYKMKFDNGRETECCAYHIWYVMDKESNEYLLKTHELIERMKTTEFYIPEAYNYETNTLVCYENSYFDNPLKLIAIEDTGRCEEVQCIKVSNDDHLYITDDYIVTHNTTSSCVLTQAIINEGYKLIKNKHKNPVEIKRGLEKATKSLVDFINKSSVKINGDKNLIKQVATISANNDESIGELIAEGLDYVGEHGAITLEKSNTPNTTLSTTEGFRIANRGYLSTYFITNDAKNECILEDVLIFVSSRKLTKVIETMDIITVAAKAGKSLLVIAEEVKDEALTTLVTNKIQGGFNICAIQGPDFGDTRKISLEDIAILTGSTLNTFMDEGSFGYAKKVIIKKEETIIIGGDYNPTLFNNRLNELKELKNNTKDDFERKIVETRLSRFSNGISVLNIGAQTEIELAEKMDRIDDALCATRAAIEEGIVPGGGTLFLKANNHLIKNKYKLNGAELDGYNIIMSILEVPLRQILLNAGSENIEEIILEIQSNKNLFKGYNAKTYKYCNMFNDGIIDPAKVVRVSLENAVSISSLFLTTECAILSNA